MGRIKRNGGRFKKGHAFLPIHRSPPIVNEVLPFQRLTSTEVDSIINKPFTTARTLDQAFADPDTSVPRLLRPKTDSTLQVDSVANNKYQYSEESKTNRVINIYQNAYMWNVCNREHRQKCPKCDGFIHWDPQAEEQWGLGVTEVMMCEKCTYRSDKYKLYREAEDGKRGRKAACINRSLQVGLSQTPIGPTFIRRLLMSVHVPPPSRTGMQASANQVCDDIEAANVLDMHGRREQLKKVNRMRGDAEHVIDIECDGVYNNKLSSGVGRTPFQHGTQCNYIVVVTNKREIIAMENVNSS